AGRRGEGIFLKEGQSLCGVFINQQLAIKSGTADHDLVKDVVGFVVVNEDEAGRSGHTGLSLGIPCANGRRSVKRLPSPGADLSVRYPPCSDAIRWAIGSPRPDPG